MYFHFLPVVIPILTLVSSPTVAAFSIVHRTQRVSSRTTAARFVSLPVSKTNNDEQDIISSTSSNKLSLTLPKPLGLILEEVEVGASKGVFVKEMSESGSASSLSPEYTQQIVGATIESVQGTNLLNANFDTVMNAIINAPAEVDMVFCVPTMDVVPDKINDYEVGTVVTILVKQANKPDVPIVAKVGDNLRKTLLENNIEVYQGMKQSFGNCGGAGQCTFCAFDFLETDGWVDRSEYEDNKISKFPGARLTCLNNIQGPATIRKTQR